MREWECLRLTSGSIGTEGTLRHDGPRFSEVKLADGDRTTQQRRSVVTSRASRFTSFECSFETYWFIYVTFGKITESLSNAPEGHEYRGSERGQNKSENKSANEIG
ncbi:hypothetical protein EYF80_000377 [Liparis tanakae]|uniref:Uncharacterized protein n=1 Tax=Liparis tanakae TaxID=230148 RepID=A0A4Z2JFQ5_9TELE|nr:hypothetical protein EYF80_000377 [Liparis tanakae]